MAPNTSLIDDRNCMDGVYDPCVCGLATPEMMTMIGIDFTGKELTAEVDYTLGKGTLRPYPVRGRLLLIEAETYDIVAFYLLRQLYRLYFPLILTLKYTHFAPPLIGCLAPPPGIRYIAAKIFDDRPLALADYYPPGPLNYNFRFQVCLIVFFCKLVGCPLSLYDIRVYNGIPYFWRANFIGLHNARTVTEEEFAYLFGISIVDARRVFVGRLKHEINASTLTEDSTAVFDGINVPEEKRDEGFLGAKWKKEKLRDKQEHLNLKSTMFDVVVKFFRDSGFEPDLIRAALYLSENPVRSSVGNRAKFKLSSSHAKIIRVIEENFSLLFGPYPFKVFRAR